MVLSRRDQALLVFLIVILIGFGFYRLIYLPISQETQTFTDRNQQLQMEKARLQVEVKKGPPEPAQTEDKFAYLDKRLPGADEIITLLTMLDQTTGKHNLPFASFDYVGDEKPNETGARTLIFNIGTQGPIIQLLDFLNELENAERLISVEEVSFNAVKAENGEMQETETVDQGPSVYYIAPPGVPEAQLPRIKLEVAQETGTTTATAVNSERPLAESFTPGIFEMEITINTYYAPSD